MPKRADRDRSVSLPGRAALSAALVLALLLALPGPAPGDQAAACVSEDRYLTYQLSYIEIDRAVALLEIMAVTGDSSAAGAAGSQSGRLRFNVVKSGVVKDKGLTFTPAKLPAERPVVIHLPDSKKVDLTVVTGTKLGGSKLSDVSTSIPQQRLLIVWDSCDPENLQKLLNLLHDHIDVPAKQILIEALVIELDRDKFKDLGFDYSGKKDGSEVQFGNVGEKGAFVPFTYVFNRPAAKTLLEFTAQVTALVDEGEAQILSRPSILVLDGRQARIKIGDKVPYAEVTTTNFGESLVSDTKYLDVGITLNLRPRASDDNSEVTMQVETLISDPGSSVDPAIGPQIESREVQTSVRVGNNTPFIIGGLISSSESSNFIGIPVLSKIPFFGKLFRRTVTLRDTTEVIVVLIPHVIPPEDRAFNLTIARDNDLFNQFGRKLFQNIYRVRRDDLWDLGFIRESEFYGCVEKTAQLQAEGFAKLLAGQESVGAGRVPVAAGDKAALAAQLRKWVEAGGSSSVKPTEQFIRIVEGRIPGEDIFVMRMLLGIIKKREWAQHIDDGTIFFFERPSGTGPKLQIRRLQTKVVELEPKSCETLGMLFETEAGAEFGFKFDPPSANLKYESISERDDYICRMRQHNCLGTGGSRWDSLAIFLNDCYEWERSPRRTGWDLLKNVLVLKRLLDLNPNLPLTLEGFHAGLEVIFPTQEDLQERTHLVDRETAELFFKVLDSYYAFELEIRGVLETIGGLKASFEKEKQRLGKQGLKVDLPAGCPWKDPDPASIPAPDPCSCQLKVAKKAGAGGAGPRSSPQDRPARSEPAASEAPQVAIHVEYGKSASPPPSLPPGTTPEAEALAAALAAQLESLPSGRAAAESPP